MKIREASLKILCGAGALIGYGCLAAFLYLVGLQAYRWFRDGEWTHVGLNDGLQIALHRCCVKGGDSGHLAGFVQWLDAPATWLGMHKVFEVVPASLALFAVSIAGNWLFIYCRDRLSAIRSPLAA
jgi:hypothetical protein